MFFHFPSVLEHFLNFMCSDGYVITYFLSYLSACVTDEALK